MESTPPTFWSALRNFFRAQADPPLLEQFYGTLLGDLESEIQDKASKEDVQAVRTILGGETRSWRGAYRAERMLVKLLRDEVVGIKLERRLEEARAVLSAHLAEHWDSAALHDDVSKNRTVYRQVLDDLQWHYTNREAIRETIRFAKYKRLLVGLLSLILAAALLGFGWTSAVTLVGISGLLGACFSMLVGMKDLEALDLPRLRISENVFEPVARACVGSIAGVFVYFLAHSSIAPDAFSGILPEAPAKEASLGAAREQMALFLGAPDVALTAQVAAQPTSAEVQTVLDELDGFLVEALDLAIAGGSLDVDELVVAHLQERVTAPAIADDRWDQLGAQLEGVLHAGRPGPLDMATLLVLAFLAGFSERLVRNLLDKSVNRVTGGPQASQPPPAGG